MRLLELSALCRDSRKLLEQLQLWELIPTEPNYLCKKCGGSLKLGRSERDADGWRWVCLNYIKKEKKKRKACGVHVSIRTGTFFSHSHLTIFQILAFVSFWVRNLPLVNIGDILGLTQQTLVSWAALCRQVILWAFIETSEHLGGEGRIIEIFGSKFGKQKHEQEKHFDGKSVLGGYERGTGRVFIVPVADDSVEKLISTITEWIAPGTTVISDCCRENEIFKHFKVNHSVVFKDPDAGTYTNLIESTNCQRKRKIFADFAKYMFLKRCEELKIDQMKEFLRLTVMLYNPMDDGTVESLSILNESEFEDEKDSLEH